MSKLLGTIEVPKYPTSILVSAKRRAVYFKETDTIPKKYQKYKFKDGYLVDDNNQKIIKNNKTFGTPKYITMSGNNLIAGYGSHHTRNKIIIELKKFYTPFVKQFLEENGPITDFPLRVTWEVHTCLQGVNWDTSNLFFYYKYFEDTLFQEKSQVIPDDSIKYITFSPGVKFVPIDDWEQRKFIFKFYHDDRPELKRLPWVQATP
jgi:hypothetical protein